MKRKIKVYQQENVVYQFKINSTPSKKQQQERPNNCRIDIDIVSMNLNEKQAIQVLQKEIEASPNIKNAFGDENESNSSDEMNLLDQTFQSMKEPEEHSRISEI